MRKSEVKKVVQYPWIIGTLQKGAFNKKSISVGECIMKNPNNLDPKYLSCKTIYKVSFRSLFCGFPWRRETDLIWITLYGVCLALYIIIELLGRVYHFSLLICYPCSSSLKNRNMLIELEWNFQVWIQESVWLFN